MLKQRILCGGGGVVERPSTMGEELTSHITHPWAATALAVHDNSPAFMACHVDGVECQERRIIGKMWLCVWVISWTGMCWKAFPVPKPIHNSITPRLPKCPTAMMTTLLSTVRMKAFEWPCCAAWERCRHILLSASWWLHGMIVSTSATDWLSEVLPNTWSSYVEQTTTSVNWDDASVTAFERNLNSCTLFLEFARNLFQSRGTGVEPSGCLVLPEPGLWGCDHGRCPKWCRVAMSNLWESW